MTMSPSESSGPAQHDSNETPVIAQPGPGQLSLLHMQQAISGPLPAASEYAGYERTLAGSADRILTMAESQLQHGMHMDREEVRFRDEKLKQDVRIITRAQWFAFGIVLVFSGLALAAVLTHQPWAAAGFGGTAVGGIVTAFFAHRRRQRQDEDNDSDS